MQQIKASEACMITKKQVLVHQNPEKGYLSNVFEAKILKTDKPWGYHLYSIWLFTFSDMKTIMFPMTIFGTVNALTSPVFGGPSISKDTLVRRIPLTLFWVWTNLCPFVIDNQRQPSSIEEDRLNKPWRPLPSGRMSEATAKRIMVYLCFAAIIPSLQLGGLKQSLALIAYGHSYNHLDGAKGLISRNAINACGFLCFGLGAMEVALGSGLPWNAHMVRWLSVVGAIVFSTVQTQDMYDQAGDASLGRSTLPLVVGDWTARWVTATAMLFWQSFARGCGVCNRRGRFSSSVMAC